MTDLEALRILGAEDSDPDAPEPVDACPTCGRALALGEGRTSRCAAGHEWHVSADRWVKGPAQKRRESTVVQLAAHHPISDSIDPATPEPLDACPECGRQYFAIVQGTRRCGAGHVWHIQAGKRAPERAVEGPGRASQGKDSGAGTEAAPPGSGEAVALASALEGLAYGVQDGGVMMRASGCRALLAEIDRLRRAAGEGMLA